MFLVTQTLPTHFASDKSKQACSSGAETYHNAMPSASLTEFYQLWIYPYE
jgi:hypothetical protein